MIAMKNSMTCFRFFIAAGPVFTPLAEAQSPVTLHHVHGLAYSADGQRLMVPSHHGLAVYSGSKWSKAAGPEHDYMGFAATQRAREGNFLMVSRTAR